MNFEDFVLLLKIMWCKFVGAVRGAFRFENSENHEKYLIFKIS